MSDASPPPAKVQPLYEGRSVPFQMLSADDFEKCVFGCFLAIQSHQGFRIDGQPAASGDGGFDVYGIAVASNRKLCIQCKRQKASLGLPLLAREVAKVAMTAHLENSDVGVHLFVCTGGVTQELRRLLRETNRTKISAAVRSALVGTNEGELAKLRERLIESGSSPEDVVGSYVQALDRLVAWDIAEFDAALSPAWDTALTVLDRFFKVSTVVREHPRPSYPREKYQATCARFSVAVQPQLTEGGLPAGLLDSSTADPGPREPPPKKTVLSVSALASLAPGEAALVVGEGGAGKSTLLRIVRAESASELGDSTLCVLICCAEYTPGGLDAVVHAQLGVKSANWRMLPDRIQILCDGINEVSIEIVRALFGELKPLLESKSISCIFTSREDSRMVGAVLPIVPCATLRLVPLSPARVRALARQELGEESMVAAFADAHIAMASRASGSFMWTPFAVRVALKRWKDTRQMGGTLGDLLDAVVTARADRDLEISSHNSALDLPRASVLAIASAMAFEMMIVDGRTACDVGDIGMTLKRATSRCSNVFGVDGLTGREFVGLLRKHDLVQRTVDDSFQWSHQLVAGGLAARQLVLHWRQHLDALQHPLTDDAWVFCTRLIQDRDLDEYLERLFVSDLMLGARATAELRNEQRDRSLKFIAKSLQTGRPEKLQVSGLFALARVGTDRAIAFLRALASDRRSDLGYQAARALAYAGDWSLLLELAAIVDKNRQGPFHITGGDVSIWETASLADRIAIARERLKLVAPGEPVNESLDLVGCDAVEEDIPLLETHMRAAKRINAWSAALAAITRADPDRAQHLLDETLAEEPSKDAKAAFVVAGHRIGLFVNADEVFCLLMDLASEEPHGASYMLTKRDLMEVLCEQPLGAATRSAIEGRLEVSAGEVRSCLWQLATRVESEVVALVALKAFSDDVESVALASNFFLAHQVLRDNNRHELRGVVDRYLQDKANWFTVHCWRVFVLQAELGFTASTVESLTGMVLRLAELLDAAERGTMPTFRASEGHIAQSFNVDTARIHLERYAALLVPGAVAGRKLLPDAVLLKFLHFDLTRSSPGKEIAVVYREMDPVVLDDELESVRDLWAQRAGLEMVCEYGLTARRLELLRVHLIETYSHLAALGYVRRALEKCWNSDTSAMVFTTVAAFDEWPEEWEQFFWDFIRMVEAKVTGADGALLEHLLPLAKTRFAGRVLRIWRDATIGSRMGLSRLEVEDSGQ